MKKERYARNELQEMASFFLEVLEGKPAGRPLEYRTEDVFTRRRVRQTLSEAAPGMVGNYGQISHDFEEDFVPRRSRRDFLENGRLREKSRGVFDKGALLWDGEQNENSRRGQEKPMYREDFELSQRLSDLYCRDARRYDGSFERY